MVEDLVGKFRQRVEFTLDKHLPSIDTHPSGLHRAMRYVALDGGKRIRPILVYGAGRIVGAAQESLDILACAVELVHVYSLVHDDLPAMDDDDLRRGKPTCHKAFDEATAILVGDGLQALAFQLIAESDLQPMGVAERLQAIATLAEAAGSRGMVGGQAIDLAVVGQTLSLAQLEDMHRHKTGALIRAAVKLGALGGGADEKTLSALDRYARAVGLAFQIRDDILDVTSDTATLGKTQGADRQHHKPTYPELLGLQQAHRQATNLCDEALESVANFDDRADLLRWIATFIVERLH